MTSEVIDVLTPAPQDQCHPPNRRQGSDTQEDTMTANAPENTADAIEPGLRRLTEDYIAAWNATDPGVRRMLVDRVWSVDGTYTDPLCDAAGRDAVDTAIAAMQDRLRAQLPGHRFVLLEGPDAHHHQLRFRWGFRAGTAEPVIVGSGVAMRDVDGKLTTVLGFLDRVPG